MLVKSDGFRLLQKKPDKICSGFQQVTFRCKRCECRVKKFRTRAPSKFGGECYGIHVSLCIDGI